MGKRHLYNRGGDYKLFIEGEEIEDALESGEWFKTEKEALECETPIEEDSAEIKTIKDFSDDEIVAEATIRGFIEKADKDSIPEQKKELIDVDKKEDDLEDEVDLDELSEDQVRALGKEAKIKGAHNMKLNTLKTRLLEL